MGNGFSETSVHKIDVKKFEENFKKIDWGSSKKEMQELGMNILCGVNEAIANGDLKIVSKLTQDEFDEIFFADRRGFYSYEEMKSKYVQE